MIITMVLICSTDTGADDDGGGRWLQIGRCQRHHHYSQHDDVDDDDDDGTGADDDGGGRWLQIRRGHYSQQRLLLHNA